MSKGLYQSSKHLLLLSIGERKQQTRAKAFAVSHRAGKFEYSANRLQMKDADRFWRDWNAELGIQSGVAQI